MIEPATMLDQPAARSAPPKRLRVALIGCGAIAEQMHLPVLAGHEQLELAVLVDRDAARAQKHAKGYGVGRVLTDTRELSRDLVDVAVIATPPFHHAPCALEMIERGIHVLVEKPMALNLAQAEAMVEAAERAGVVLSVGFFRRLYPSIRLMKAMLDGGQYGRPQSFSVEGGGMYKWSAATLGNMRRDMAGGGVLIDFGSHMIDLLFALFDEPAQVLEYRDNALGGVEADCTARVRVRHAGQPVEGTIELARCRNLGSFVRVECEEATLELGISERYRIKVTPRLATAVDPMSGQSRDLRLDATWHDEPEAPWYESFRTSIDDWLQAIETGGEPRLSGRSALATVRLIDACYANAEPMDEPWTDHPLCHDRPEHALVAHSSNGHAEPKPRRVLITGASGFIGCRLAEILSQRAAYRVRGMVHNPANAARLARLNVELVQADICDAEALRACVADCDAVVHCAIGTTYGDKKRIAEVTVGGTRKLVQAAREAGVSRFVHLSTIAVYGDAEGTIDESTPVRVRKGDNYGGSKLLAEQAVLAAAREGLSAVVLRPSCVYGPFGTTFVTRPLQHLVRGKLILENSADTLSNTVYVDNLAEAIIRAIEGPSELRGEVFTVSDDDGLTWGEFYGFFAERLNARFVCESAKKSNSNARARKPNLLGAVSEIARSSELKALVKKVLHTDPIGRLPRAMVFGVPGVEDWLRRRLGSDAPEIYRRAARLEKADVLRITPRHALVKSDKARRVLGLGPLILREAALQRTYQWVCSARIL